MQQSGPAAAPSAAAPLVGWGAAVHGSSAFLEATSVEPQQACSVSVSGVHAQSAHGGQPGHNQTFPSSWPDNSNRPGASTQHHSWHQSCGSAGLPASQPHPPHPTTWPQLAHPHQQPAYVPHQHGLQQSSCLPCPQRYAWESYHAHSAMAGIEATGTTGVPTAAAAMDGWYGWSSHYGARPPQPYPYPGAPPLSPPQPQSPSLCNGGGGGVPGASANGSGGPAAQAPTETGDGDGGGDEAYDPLADVDVPDQAAADPKGGVSPPGPSVTAAAAAAAASPAADRPVGQAAAKHADGDVADPLALVQAEEAAPGGPPPVAVSQSVDLIVVWDLDETLIVFNSLLSGAFARAVSASAAQGAAVAAATATVAATAAAAACCGGSASGGEGHPPSPSSPPLADRATALGQQLADLVFNFCDDHLSFQQLDSTDPQSFVELWALAATAGSADTTVEAEAAAAAAATTAAAVATAARACASVVQRASLERIAEVYGGGAEGLPDVIGEAGCRTLSAAMAEAERLTGGWVAAARRLLTGVTAAAAAASAGGASATAAGSSEGTWLGGGSPSWTAAEALKFRRVRHVLVSAGHLVATLGKLLLWGLDEHFDIRDVYSASGRPKLEVFRYLRARYGPNSAFAAVGDGLEEERAAAALGWGFVRVALAETAAQPAAAVAEAGAATAAAGVGAGVGSGLPGSRSGSVVQQVARAAARPLGAIQPEDVLTAARQAYYD